MKQDRQSVSVILADDNQSTLAAIARFLKDENYNVVGAVRDGAELVSEAAGTEADIAVIDIFMPQVSGLDAAAQLRSRNSGTKVVILTAHREPEFVRAAFASGAVGYVLKHRLVTDLPTAIEQALLGRKFLSPPLANSLT